MPPLSVTIITLNEAAHIAAALDSVAWADERIVVDSGSTDDTVRIARAHGARVESRPWQGYSAQKNYAASLATHDWILSLDADERVSEPLGSEIRQVLDTPAPRHGYRIPARRLLPRTLDPQHRLVARLPAAALRPARRASGTGPRARVRARQRTGGPLRGELQHYPYPTVADHLDTIDRYTTLAARELYENGRRAGFSRIAVHPALAFARNYVLRGGFRQGTAGLVVSPLNSYYVLLKFVKLGSWSTPARSAAAREPSNVGARAS